MGPQGAPWTRLPRTREGDFARRESPGRLVWHCEMSESQPDSLQRRIADALARIQVVTSAAGRKSSGDEGLSPLQSLLLRTLASRGGMRIGALASALRVTPGTVSVAVDAMEDKGHVRRGPDPEEHRAVLVHLTPKGRRASERLGESAGSRLEPVVEAVGERRAGEILQSLLTVIDAAEREGLVDPTRMCIACRHFQPWGARGERASTPHRCGLLERDIGPVDLRVDCPEFDPGERAGVGVPDGAR